MNENQENICEYPDETAGSVLAQEAREKANCLTEQEREELFRTGMTSIYSANGNKAAVCCKY